MAGMENETKEGLFNRFRRSFLGEIVQIVVISLIIVIPFRIYIAQPFLVSGPSMDDTFANGQYLIVDELTYNLRDPQRGEVVIFRYPLDTKKYFIKRVIGLPGETVEIKNDVVTICKPDCQTDTNKFSLTETYTKPATPIKTDDTLTVTLKADEYYVMGDNRRSSSDSRSWGPVKRNLFTGRPFMRLFPFNKISFFPGQIQTAHQPITNTEK
jgi:signal peptidase I